MQNMTDNILHQRAQMPSGNEIRAEVFPTEGYLVLGHVIMMALCDTVCYLERYLFHTKANTIAILSITWHSIKTFQIRQNLNWPRTMAKTLVEM